MKTQKFLTNPNITLLGVSLLFLLIYTLLPTSNSTIDAYGYANYIKYGENLFQSHHLLYNSFGYIWISVISVFGNVDSLAGLKVMNALFAAASLMVLGAIFSLQKYELKKILVWVLLVGSTWGVMRFATENETYIIPIFFSLLASLYYFKFFQSNKTSHLLLSGFWAAFACLVHQIHFFWWLAILISLLKKRNLKLIFYYALPALIVPLGYVLVMAFYYSLPLSIESLTQFVFRDFHSGSATVSLGLKSILFVGISFVRTFIQVHGYFINLLKLHPWVFIGIGLAIASVFWGLMGFKKVLFEKVSSISLFTGAHIIAFFLQLLFAFLSHGNAEFMVMLPFLLAIGLSSLLKNEIRIVGFIAGGMLIWNLSLGLVPLKTYNLDGNTLTARSIEKADSTKTLFIVFNKPAVENQVRFYVGNYPNNIISATQTLNYIGVRNAIEEALYNGKEVYTDCLFRPQTISRESLTIEFNPEIFAGFETKKVDSITTISGKYYIVKLINSDSN